MLREFPQWRNKNVHLPSVRVEENWIGENRLIEQIEEVM
jgi:hypothetical protein